MSEWLGGLWVLRGLVILTSAYILCQLLFVYRNGFYRVSLTFAQGFILGGYILRILEEMGWIDVSPQAANSLFALALLTVNVAGISMLRGAAGKLHKPWDGVERRRTEEATDSE